MDALRYVNSDGHQLAYRERPGAEGRVVVLFTPGGTVPMDFLERDRIGARLLDGLASIGSVVLFDRRGIGLSDPIVDWSRPVVEQWADDLAAIVATACTIAPVVVSLGDLWGPARFFAGNNPEALEALVLYEPTGPADLVDMTQQIAKQVGTFADAFQGGDDWIARVCPSRADDAAFREWFDTAGRTGASPSIAARLYERPPEQSVASLTAAQGKISVPTLVLRRPGNYLGSAEQPDPVSTAVLDGRRVDLSGNDFHWLGEDIDELLVEISRFVTGEHRLPDPERSLCAVLITDLVASTEHATAVGDARWKSILDRHDAAVTEAIERHGGSVVKHTGDGVLATLASADRALRAAETIRTRLASQGLTARIGVHVGDVERRGNDLAGIAIHVAARVMARAGPGEVLVTASVPIAVAGTAHRFEAVGDYPLKGVPGTWTLYRDITAIKTNELA